MISLPGSRSARFKKDPIFSLSLFLSNCVDCTVALPEKVGVIRPISRDPREEEEGAESPELKPRPLTIHTTNRVTNNNSTISTNSAGKEFIIIEKPAVIVPVESWLKNTQVSKI